MPYSFWSIELLLVSKMVQDEMSMNLNINIFQRLTFWLRSPVTNATSISATQVREEGHWEMKLAVISPYPKQQVVAQRKIFWPTTPSMVGCSPLPLWLVYKAHSGFLKNMIQIPLPENVFAVLWIFWRWEKSEVVIFKWRPLVLMGISLIIKKQI